MFVNAIGFAAAGAFSVIAPTGAVVITCCAISLIALEPALIPLAARNGSATKPPASSPPAAAFSRIALSVVTPDGITGGSILLRSISSDVGSKVGDSNAAAARLIRSIKPPPCRSVAKRPINSNSCSTSPPNPSVDLTPPRAMPAIPSTTILPICAGLMVSASAGNVIPPWARNSSRADGCSPATSSGSVGWPTPTISIRNGFSSVASVAVVAGPAAS